MKYNLVKILLVTNALSIAAAFIYFSFKYSNWDVTIVFFLLFIYAIVIVLIYNWIDGLHIKENKQLKELGIQLSLAKNEALKMLEEKRKMVVREPHYTIDNKTENDQKRYSNSYPSLGHIGEDEHDPLTECERNNAIYMAKHASDN